MGGGGGTHAHIFFQKTASVFKGALFCLEVVNKTSPTTIQAVLCLLDALGVLSLNVMMGENPEKNRRNI